MRGRKRQRKKDAKKRGVWGAPAIFTAKRQSEQPIADALTQAYAFRCAFRRNVMIDRAFAGYVDTSHGG